MEDRLMQTKEVVGEEEYVLLDLEDCCGQVDIPANASYVLSGMDTLNPVLVIGNRIKMIGVYEKTIGTCYVFSETDAPNVVLQSESGPSETNLIRETSIIDPNQPTKNVRLITAVHKVLKFKLATGDESPSCGVHGCIISSFGFLHHDNLAISFDGSTKCYIYHKRNK